MNSMDWQCDEHGTQNLNPVIDGVRGHVWIQARRPYCDRGHWEWGNMGLRIDRSTLPTPSYYFMHRDNAVAEIEEWVARMQGATSPTRSIDDLGETGFSQAQGIEQGWHWRRNEQGALMAIASNEGGLVQLALREVQVQGGPAFVLAVEAGMEHDGADCFPRTYLDLDRAIMETEAFLAWRLLQKPTAIPGPIQESDRPVGALLGATQPTRQPARRRP